MKKRKSIIALSAVLLAAVFALSCCFFAACKDKEEEHEHNYSQVGYDDDSHWNYCPDDNEIDESSVTGHTWTESGTTPATCTDYAATTYTCTCGASKTVEDIEGGLKEHTYNEVAFEWKDDYSSATASVVCSVCGDIKEGSTVEATVTSDIDETGTTYTATATIDGKEYTDTKFVAVGAEESKYTQSRVYDFDNPETYENFMKPNASGYVWGTYSSGIVSFVNKTDGTSSIESKDMDEEGTTRSAWVPNGKSGTTCYVEIDLSTYIGKFVKIEIEFAANAKAESGRSLYIGTSNVDASKEGSASELIAETKTTSCDVNDVKTLVFETEITETYKKLYLDSDASLCFYKISVSLTGDIDPWADEITTMETARVTAPKGNVVWNETTYSNANAGISISAARENEDGSILYEVSGEASAFTSEGEANTYWEGVAQVGDLYVYLEINLEVGETMTWSNGSYTNRGESAEIGQFIIGIYNGGTWSFKISTGTKESSDYVETTYIVSFAGITNLPEEGVIAKLEYDLTNLTTEQQSSLSSHTEVSFDEGEILTFIPSGSSSYNSSNRLRTGGATTYSESVGTNYFAIDLSSYTEATSVTIEIYYGGQGDESSTCYLYFTNTLMAASSVTENSILDTMSHQSKSTTTDSVTISLESLTEKTIYILCSMNTDFYTIGITVK